MRLVMLTVLLAAALPAGEATRAEQEARALAAVIALPDGERRAAGLQVVRAAWRRFRDEAQAAALPPGEDDPPRLAELRARNAGIAALRELAEKQGAAAVSALVEAHLARWPLDDEAQALLGLARLAGGDRDGALRALTTVLALDPEVAAARELRGRLFVDAEDEAIAATAAADLAPLLARLLAEGCAAEAAGDVVAAQRALAAIVPLMRAVRGPAAEGRLAALRAGAAERAGEHAAALALWRTAAAAGVAPPDPAPRIRALVRHLHAGRVDTAVAAGDAADLRLLSPAFSERDEVQDRLFRLLLTRGRLAEVRDAARELLAADAQHPLAALLADGAQAALDPRRLELLPPVIARIRLAAPALGARFPVLYGLDAALTEAAGDAAGAAAALDPLLAARPDDRDARWQRARLRLAAGDAAGALADCTALLAGREDDVDALALRGRARATAGDAAGALADVERVVALRPGCAALLARARVRRQLGDATGTASDLAALLAAAQQPGDSLLLLDAVELAPDAHGQRQLLEKASQLGNAEATLRLRRLPR